MGIGGDYEEREEHESFGMVSFSRRTGNPGRLFGSSLRTHESYVTLAVKRAVRIHSNGCDRYYGGTRGDIVEVDLSAAQFADLLTTMNVGLGTPCTIRWLDSKRIPNPPEDIKLEVEKVRETFKSDMGRVAKDIHAKRKQVEEILSKKSVTQADRKQVIDLFRTMAMNVESNIPFMLEQFEEASEKVVQHAKAEIDSFITSNVMAAGLRSLSENAGTPQLTSGESADGPTSADEVAEEVLDEDMPKRWSDVYVPTALYIDRGEDDVQGGLAKIVRVEKSVSGGRPEWFVMVAEVPGVRYNYRHLLPQQERLKAEFGDRRARPDPDRG